MPLYNPVVSSGSSIGYGTAPGRLYIYEDFANQPATNLGSNFVQTVNGTAAAISNIAVGSLNATGIVSLDLGTTTTGRSGISGATASNLVNLKFGIGRARFGAKCAIHVLSNGTDTFTTRVGFIDSISSAGVTDGAYFRYTDSVNSGKWQAVTVSNTTETAQDTGIAPVADAWHLMEIDVDAAGANVIFKIDGVQVGSTSTTNIPTGAGRETSFGVAGIKSAGTTATSALYVDFIEVEQIFTTAR